MIWNTKPSVTPYIDGTVYPDCEPPENFDDDLDKADYLHRISTAMDFGLMPENQTLELLKTWKDIFDKFPVRQSSGYHALRDFFGWESFERTPYFKEPLYVSLDQEENRTDPCEDML